MLTEGLDLMDIAGVAERLATTEKQIRNMRDRGQIPAPFKIPGLGLRWSSRAIDEWLAGVLVLTPSRAPTLRPGPKARAARRAL